MLLNILIWKYFTFDFISLIQGEIMSLKSLKKRYLKSKFNVSAQFNI